MVFLISFFIFSGTGTPRWAAVRLGLTLDSSSCFSGLVFFVSLGVFVFFSEIFFAGLISLFVNLTFDATLTLRTLDFLDAAACCDLLDLGLSGAVDFRNASFVAGFSLRAGLSSGGGERRRLILGGVCASEVCRPSSAALLNSCPQSQRCSASADPASQPTRTEPQLSHSLHYNYYTYRRLMPVKRYETIDRPTLSWRLKNL